VVVQSDPGMMGGSGSHEFMAPSAAGEDDVALCDACGYAANVELARGVPAAPPASDGGRGEVATPNARTIAEVSAQLEIDPAGTIKTLVFIGPDGPVLALVRGDHALHERKLARVLKAEARPAHPEEIKRHLGVAPGSVGPLEVRGARIVADESLRQGRYVVGANREGFHATGVTPGQDFACEWADLQVALAGEGCPTCGKAMVIKHGRFGKFMACSGYPECKTTKPVPLGIPCPQDGGQLVERRSKRGNSGQMWEVRC